MIYIIRTGKLGWMLWIVVSALLLLASAVHADLVDGGATTSNERSSALPPGLEIFASAAEVPDIELATMRGRFTTGNRVMFFGVEMLTRWITAVGEVFVAALNVEIDWDVVRFRPNINITRTVAGGPATGSPQMPAHNTPAPAEASSEIDLGGFKNASGVGQMIQVTGDDNRIHNDVILDIGSGGPQPNPNPSDPVGATDDSVNVGDTTGSGVKTTPGAEAVVTTTLGSSGLGVSVAVPGQGWAVQTINSMMGLRQAAALHRSKGPVMEGRLATM